MPQTLNVGSAVANPGGYAYGSIRVLDLPTGGHEEIPVVIAQGKSNGPTVWVTANIHGGELTGLASLHQILKPELPAALSGMLIAIPSLNPAGLRVMQRAPYYEPGDPNRTWPLPNTDRSQPPSGVYESISRQLFDIIVGTEPICLLDLHNASIGSIPFNIRDRILYGDRVTETQAREMEQQLDRLSEAFGISIVNENPGKVYAERKLHRSVSGSMVNAAGIPSLTLELGMGMAIDPAAVQAGAQGIINVLRMYGLLSGQPEPITSVPVPDLGFPVRRDDSARIPVSGILQHLINPGDRFNAGQTIARMVDIYGRPIEGGDVTVKHDGWLIGWSHGIAKYAGQSAGSLAVRDDEPLIIHWQE